ncbi:hypothetical protein BZA77DRAFT_311897 [Pyronema omphalodes]|nr:hypothetical protein BZA77DRAFT_311897 [Pyronema omphalodes]
MPISSIILAHVSFFWLLRCLSTASGFIVRRQVMVTATAAEAAAAVHSAGTPLWDTCNIFTSNTSSDQFIASTTIFLFFTNDAGRG